MSARTLISVTLLTAGLKFPAHAHSWYPKECCSEHDCMPADAMVTNEQGEKVVIVGPHRISIPRRLASRSSPPDSRIHICFAVRTSEYGPYDLPLCLFLPAQS